MITLDQQRSWLQQLLAQQPPDLPGGDLPWLHRARDTARTAVTELPVLDRRQEAWRYTDVQGLLGRQFTLASDEVAASPLPDISDWLLPTFDSHRLVFIDGRYVPRLSRIGNLPDGVNLGSLRAALSTDPGLLSTWFGQTANHTEHVFTALNTALSNDGAFLHISEEIELERPIEVIHLSSGRQGPIVIQPRNLFVLESGASATLAERYISDADPRYFNNGLTEVSVHDHASLTHYRLQDESREAFHLSSLYLSLAGQGHYDGTTVAFGAAWSRTDYNVDFGGQGGKCTLSGLYTAGDRQLNDFHLKVRHRVPGCTSRECFKGIVYGKGRAVFDGHIRVERQAQKTDAHLSNHNLMLSRSAEVDTKPQLEIYADDVKCSHGTTIGQIDPQQLFYLRSRGIDEMMAQRMLCLGFAGEILDDITLEPLRKHITDRLADTLDRVLTPETAE